MSKIEETASEPRAILITASQAAVITGIFVKLMNNSKSFLRDRAIELDAQMKTKMFEEEDDEGKIFLVRDMEKVLASIKRAAEAE